MAQKSTLISIVHVTKLQNICRRPFLKFFVCSPGCVQFVHVVLWNRIFKKESDEIRKIRLKIVYNTCYPL